MNTLVIHGSALTAKKPRDIDVIYTGHFGLEEEIAIRNWAKQHPYLNDLPIDAKKSISDSVIYVPQAANSRVQFELIQGSVEIRLHTSWDLPALIRGLDPPALAAAIRNGARLCIFGNSHSFREYVQGLTALRNAISHAVAWEGMPAAKEIARLANEGASAEAILALTPGSQAGAGEDVVCRVKVDGLHSCYGHVFIPWEQAR